VRQRLGGKTYRFRAWSDGKAATHLVDAPAEKSAYTAIFDAQRIVPVPAPAPARVRASDEAPP